MPLADITPESWVTGGLSLGTLLVLSLFGFLKYHTDRRFNLDINTLRNDNAALREDHEECQKDIAGLKASNAEKDKRIDFERRVKHDLAQFMTTLFFDMGRRGEDAAKVDELRTRYLALYRAYSPEGD